MTFRNEVVSFSMVREEVKVFLGVDVVVEKRDVLELCKAVDDDSDSVVSLCFMDDRILLLSA